MIRSIFACFNGKVSHKKAKVEPVDVEVTKTVYRDELTKKERARKVKKTVRFAEKEATILGEDDEKEFEKRRCESGGNEEGEKEGMRVRVKLTKEEAARLLSKCNGGTLQFKDIAHELVFIPVNRVCILSNAANTL
ncbi:unnamed protein product [Sphenostylis stenocarpa]|uniref:DUF7890 domain-containing protein n=1 Tax=Sphenostylis stenocarpa TaxID=92480 RepID=A0AA86S028_9FABA|nr:unnamed protein product [Sphenostylis stenocarpa]